MSTESGTRRCLVLDAMGVIFKAADDVAELLIPFIRENSGVRDEGVIQSAYLAASLGEIGAGEFWAQVGLNPGLEDEFLALKAKKSTMDTQDFYHELEPLLVSIAKLQQEIDAVTGWVETNE